MTTRRTTPKTATVYGARAEGPTMQDAKACAIRRIEGAFTDEWDFLNPAMTRFPLGHVGLVYRTLDAWQYQLLWADEAATRGYCISRYSTAQEADRAMRRHLAQQYIDVLPDHGAGLLQGGDEAGQREHRRVVRFRQAYQRFQVQGHASHTCHRLACEAMDTPEPEARRA